MPSFISKVFFFSAQLLVFLATGQGKMDSLRAIRMAELPFEQQLSTYNEIIRANISNEDSTIKYASALLELAADMSVEFECKANYYLGQSYQTRGEYQTALGYLLRALTLSEQSPRSDKVTLYSILGSLYNKLDDVGNMKLHYLLAIKESSKGQTRNDSISIAIQFNNLAEGFKNHTQYDSALHYYDLAKKLTQQLNLKKFGSLIGGNIGMAYAYLKDYEQAVPLLITGINTSIDVNDPLFESAFTNCLAEVYVNNGKAEEAEILLKRSLSLSMDNGLKEQITDAHRLLSDLYFEEEDYKQSLFFYKQYEIYKDSLENIGSVKAISKMRKEYEVGQKQAEVDLLLAEKRTHQMMMFAAIGFSLILVILLSFIYRFYREKTRVNKLLESQKEELEQLNVTKDKFFSIISHDLRGPVTSFFGISRLIRFLAAKNDTDQIIKIADDVDHSVEQLSKLLDNLLNWAMQRQGNIPYVPEKISFSYLAQDLTAIFKTMAKSKNITLDTEVSENVWIWADRNTSMTIFRNLINNALKFTPEGGTVTLFASEKDGIVNAGVRDTGVGIPKEKLESLFTLGDKKSTYGTSGEKGLGLGLQLVYEFIELNKGDIKVESESGMGTTFTVILPSFTPELSQVMPA